MTPRKELFIAVKAALATIEDLEYVDLFRKQISNGFEWTAALIRIGKVDWVTMTEQNQEGNCQIDIMLLCKDGWMDQHQDTADPDHGLIEIDLIDSIAEKLQFLKGDQFTPLLQTDDDEDDGFDVPGIMAYRIGFSTMIYRKLKPKYGKLSLNLKPDINVSE